MRRNPRELINAYQARSRSRARARAELADNENLELRERIAQQWAEVRAARRPMEVEPEIVGGPSNLRRGQVPYGMDLAAAWSLPLSLPDLARASAALLGAALLPNPRPLPDFRTC